MNYIHMIMYAGIIVLTFGFITNFTELSNLDFFSFILFMFTNPITLIGGLMVSIPFVIFYTRTNYMEGTSNEVS